MKHDPILAPFDRLVARGPERPLLMTPTRSASARDLDALSRALAERLREGLAPDDLVALAIPNGPGFLAALLAVRHAGMGAALLDAGAPPAERARAAKAMGSAASLHCPTGWPSSPADFVLSKVETNDPRPAPGAPVVKVTSGSTGTPRGVLMSAENLCADEGALFVSMGLSDQDRILATIPMSHSYGLSSVALPALLRGSLLLLPDEGAGPLAPLEIARAAEATYFPTVPAYLQGLVRLRRPELWPASLRLVVSAGAALAPATAAEFRALHGLPVHAFYGASECGGISYDRDGGAAERGTVGTPVEGVRITLEPTTATDRSVVVRSAAVGVGYLPAPSPQLEKGTFRTSDRAEWAGDELRLLGRGDELINVKGRKVDPAEVEAVLGRLVGVHEVVVLGVPSRVDGSQTVRAVISCQPGALSPETVLAFCRAHLAEHKVPRSVRLLPEIPRTARGKVDRAALVAAGDADLGRA